METKLILDGKQVLKKDYEEKSKDIQAAVIISNEEVHAFSNEKDCERWIASSKLAEKYFDEKKRMDQARNLINKIGEDKAHQLFNKLQDNLNEAGQCMNSLFKAVAESSEKPLKEEKEDLVALYKTLLSTKVGTAWFYKEPDYTSQFDTFQGLFKISSPYVGDENNDTLSSIMVIGSNIILCEHSWWKGRWVVIAGYSTISFVNEWSWFNDMMSSYWFWG